MAGGCSNKDAAQQLRLSVETVKHHVTSIFDKIGVSSRLELALFAAAHGLIETSPGAPDSEPARAHRVQSGRQGPSPGCNLPRDGTRQGSQHYPDYGPTVRIRPCVNSPSQLHKAVGTPRSRRPLVILELGSADLDSGLH